MRKLKLLLVTLALIVGGIGSAWAQSWTDVTGTYINNPGFEEGHSIQTTFQAGTGNERYIIKPNGWTVLHSHSNENDLTCLTTSDKQSGSFSSYTMNHSGEKTYWTRLRWGGWTWTPSGPTGNPTSLELQQKMSALPSGVYRLSADLLCYAGGTEANNHVYLKANSSNNTWKEEPTINHTKADANWENKSFIITSSGTTEYTVGLQILQQWTGTELISGFDDVKLERYSATTEHPIELLSVVHTGTENWTNNNANNTGTFSNGGVNMVERYYKQHYTGTVSELVVNDLPIGNYEAEVYCQAHCADWECSPIAEAAGQTDRTILSANTVEVGIPIVNDRNLTEGPQVRTLSNISVTDGTLTFKVRNDQQGANWLTFEVKSLKYLGAGDLASIKAVYSAAKTAAETARDNEAYNSIVGAERTALTTAINAISEETEEWYSNAITALKKTTASFNDAVVAEYTLLSTEKEKATNLGMTNEAITSATPNTKTGLKALQDLKVAEYTYVTTTYQHGVALGEWTSEATNTSAATFDNQHWSGTTHEYKNQNDNDGQGWNSNSGWSIDFNQNVTLPAGNYVFKVAGRRAPGDAMTMSLIVKNGDDELGKVDDFPQSNNSRGINKSGETAFDGDDANFANGGAGFGWEWRYVKFTLATDATVNLSIKAVATAGHQWLSFGDYTLQTDNEANISLIAYNIALNDAQTAIANDDYTNVIGSEKTELQAAIDADGSLDKTDKTAIDAAKENLVSKTSAFTGAKASYDAFVAAKAVEYTKDLPYASATKYDAIAAAQSAADATSKSDAETKTNAILSAYRQYVESNALAEGVAGAEPIAVSDPNMEVTYNSESHKFGAWQVFGQTTGNNIQLLSSESFIDGDGNHNYKYADIYKNDNNAGIKQTVKLQPGKYILTVTARAKTTDGATFRVFAGDQTTNIPRVGNTGGVFDRGWNDATVEFIVNEEKDVEIGVQSGNGKDLWWSATRFRLTKIAGVENLNMTITDAEWATFIAPFDVTIPDGVKAYTVEGINTDGETLDKTEVTTGTIEANTPVLLNGPAGTYPVSGVNIADESSYKVGALVGVYEDYKPVSGGGNDNYVLQNQNPGNGLGFYITDTDASNVPTVSPNHAYLQVASGGSAKAFFFDDDDAMNIEGIDVQNSSEYDAIYNAAGMQVESLQKGLNIVVKDGKSYKIYVK